MDDANLAQYYADNVGLVHTVAKKGYGRLQAIGASIDYNDLMQDMSVVFIKSFRLFDPTKGKFSTYFMQAAFNRLNKVAEVFEIERLELGIKSVEELGNGADEDFDLTETIASEAYTPEQQVEGQSLARAIEFGLSPLAKKMLEWVVDPPEVVEHELEAKRAHTERARESGQLRRCKVSMNISFIAEIMEIGGVSRSAIKAARLEIEAAVERNIR